MKIESTSQARRKPVYYFRNLDDERCYTLDYHLSDAKDEGLTEMDLYEAVPEKVNGFFWCRAVDESAEEGFCGKDCEEYEPKNGRSGMCRHKGHFHTAGQKVQFKIN